MKVKIDRMGYLYLERTAKLKKQGCPTDPSGQAYCGDWCPLFRVEGDFLIKLCQGVVYGVDPVDFLDERTTKTGV